MTRLGLTVNEAKTSLKNARQERFDFLGYSFGPHRHKANGLWYLSASPSKKSVQRLKTKVGNLLVPGNNDPWPEGSRDRGEARHPAKALRRPLERPAPHPQISSNWMAIGW
jgi:RNA-directed DNA polymerase